MPTDDVARIPRRYKVDVWRCLMEVHAAVLREIEAVLAERHGLSLTEFDTLVNIPSAGVRAHELTERVILSQSALSRLCDRLARRGLIDREPSSTDQRGVEIRLTPAGRRLVASAARSNADVVEEHFADRLSADELRTLGDILAELRVGSPARAR